MAIKLLLLFLLTISIANLQILFLNSLIITQSKAWNVPLSAGRKSGFVDKSAQATQAETLTRKDELPVSTMNV